MAKSHASKQKQKSVHKKATVAVKPKFTPSKARSESKTTGSTTDDGLSLVDWKNIYVFDAKPKDIQNMHEGAIGRNGKTKEWDFSHLPKVLRKVQEENESCELYMFGSQPFNYNTVHRQSTDSRMVPLCPTFGIIPMKGGKPPPPYIAVRKHGQELDIIKHFRALGLSWEPVQNTSGVFALRSSRRECSHMSEYDNVARDYTTLFIMKPNDSIRKDNDQLDIQHATFSYQVGDELIIDGEVYTKGQDTFADICNRFDLNVDEHRASVKQAVAQGFTKRRQQIEKQIDLLSDYPEDVLNEVSVVKIFPRNTSLSDADRNELYINKYYGYAKSDPTTNTTHG